ncbi:MAG: hypothetical protein PUF32_09485 [Prevotella sp.]|nr:hypothetical protein [Prevotella sp.]MDD7336028.1 hypothetical protein [Prevotella sp.]MDY5257495.1 hypothetical protein [Prevotella sp.]
MDALSSELQRFLIHMGKASHLIDPKTEGYVRSLLKLLTVADEQVLTQYYGLFGSQVQSLDSLAAHYGVTAEVMQQVIETCLRKLAVTPEWQMIKNKV